MQALKLLARAAGAAGLVLALALPRPSAWAQDGHDKPELEPGPEGVDILLPRGGIPAIFDPTFVSADEAEIPDDAWILGVAIGDEARAYSLNILNGHEVVNDMVGETPIAAVW